MSKSAKERAAFLEHVTNLLEEAVELDDTIHEVDVQFGSSDQLAVTNVEAIDTPCIATATIHHKTRKASIAVLKGGKWERQEIDLSNVHAS